MSKLLLFLALFSSFSSFSQSLEDVEKDHLVRFTSPIIDYEVYEGNVVALTRKKQEYFIYYIDSSGAGLFQQYDIFFATDIETNDLGELHLLGLDSAYHLSVSNSIETVRSFGRDSYDYESATRSVHFNETAAYFGDASLSFYEKNEDDENTLIRYYSFPPSLIIDDPTATKNILFGDLHHTRGVRARARRNPHLYAVTQTFDEVHGYKVANCFWMVTEGDKRLTIYSSDGVFLQSNVITSYPFKGQLIYDKEEEKVYFVTKKEAGLTEILELKQDGMLQPVTEFRKGIGRSDLKINGGYLYYRDAKGKGESIVRVQLNNSAI